MATSTLRTVVPNPGDWLTKRTLRIWLGVILLEAYLLFAYFAFGGAAPTQAIRYLVYPFVWINVGLWAVATADPEPGSRRHWAVGALIGVAYFLVVMYIPGFIGTGTAHHLHPHVRIGWYAPGWGPLIAVNSSWLRLYLVPFEVIGYASLAYLVYVNALSLIRGTVSGALGLVTCVGCTVPVLAPLLGVLGGPASALTTMAYAYSYDIGTLIYVVTVALLFHSHRNAP